MHKIHERHPPDSKGNMKNTGSLWYTGIHGYLRHGVFQ